MEAEKNQEMEVPTRNLVAQLTGHALSTSEIDLRTYLIDVTFLTDRCVPLYNLCNFKIKSYHLKS